MRRNRLVLKLLAAAFLPLLASCASDAYKVVGTVSDWDGTAVLTYNDFEGGIFSDTTSVVKGSFVFKGEINDVYHANVVVSADGKTPVMTFLVLEKGTISIKMDPDALKDNTYSKYQCCEAVVKGTRNNDFLIDLDAAVSSDSTKSFDGYKAKMLECINSHKDCEYAGFLYGITFDDQPLDEFEAGFLSFPEHVRNSSLTVNIRRDINDRKISAAGNEAPDFTLYDRNGKEVTLSSFRGQYVVVDFWASWCGPCRKGVPGMKEIYAIYHEKGLEIIAVSQDNNRESWLKALDEDQTEYIHVIDDTVEDGRTLRVGSIYGVRSIPAYFLIDKEGRFVGKFEHEALKEQLSVLLQ